MVMMSTRRSPDDEFFLDRGRNVKGGRLPTPAAPDQKTSCMDLDLFEITAWMGNFASNYEQAFGLSQISSWVSCQPDSGRSITNLIFAVSDAKLM